MTEPFMRFIGRSGHLALDEDVPVYIKRSRLRTLRCSGIAWLVRGIWVGVTVGNMGRTATFCGFNKAHTFDGKLVEMPCYRPGAADDASTLLDVQICKIATGGFEPHNILRAVDAEVQLAAFMYPELRCPEGIPYIIHALDREPREIAYASFRENSL